MPFDVIRANAKTEAVNEAFARIGCAGDTKMPASKNNAEPLAWEYHQASHLLRLAEARKKRAHADAVKAGVLFDHEAQPLPVGTNKLVFAGELVEISVAVAPAGTRFDLPGLLQDLLRAGFDQAKLTKLVAKRTAESRPAHRFLSSLVTL